MPSAVTQAFLDVQATLVTKSRTTQIIAKTSLKGSDNKKCLEMRTKLKIILLLRIKKKRKYLKFNSPAVKKNVMTLKKIVMMILTWMIQTRCLAYKDLIICKTLSQTRMIYRTWTSSSNRKI